MFPQLQVRIISQGNSCFGYWPRQRETQRCHGHMARSEKCRKCAARVTYKTTKKISLFTTQKVASYFVGNVLALKCELDLQRKEKKFVKNAQYLDAGSV